MPGRGRAEKRPGVRWRRQRAWAASVFVAGLLLFAWPFVRTPPLSIGQSYAHLLAAWSLVIAGLAGMARALRPGDDRGSEDG